MFSSLSVLACVGLFLVNFANSLQINRRFFFIFPKTAQNFLNFRCNIFFGSSGVTFDTEEYRKQLQWDKYYKQLDSHTTQPLQHTQPIQSTKPSRPTDTKPSKDKHIIDGINTSDSINAIDKVNSTEIDNVDREDKDKVVEVEDLRSDEYFKKIEQNVDLPLAPEYEDEPLCEVEHEWDLERPPNSKEEWSLRRISHGRRFWHRFFSEPSSQTLRALRWCKYQHDRFHCNRILEREITHLPKILPRKGEDGKPVKLSRKERMLNKHSVKVSKRVVGYDNTSERSNLLILANFPQSRLVNLVEKIRMRGVLDLRNFELLRLLKTSMLHLAKPNNFVNLVNFLLAFSALDPKSDSPTLTFGFKPRKKLMRYKPMIYAVIGKLRNNPFEEDLLLPRKARAKPLRDPYPNYADPNSVLNRFLDSAWHLLMTERRAERDQNAALDRTFSDIFDRDQNYTTKLSVNNLDFPKLVDFKLLNPFLNTIPSTNPCDTVQPSLHNTQLGQPSELGNLGDGVNSDDIVNLGDKVVVGDKVVRWDKEDVKEMLRRLRRFGLTRVETLVRRFKRLHNEVGLSFEDILRLGRENPQVFQFGDYRQHCLRIYDIDEGFTHEMVNALVRKMPRILAYNIDRCLKPKILYLTRNIGKGLNELLEFPKYLSFSLYQRIIPRHFAIMNRYYKGEFLPVYRFLFETGFYHSYGQPVTHPKIPDLKPENHDKYMQLYKNYSSSIDLRLMLCTGDAKFCEAFNLSYRDLIQGKESAFKIPLPTNVF